MESFKLIQYYFYVYNKPVSREEVEEFWYSLTPAEQMTLMHDILNNR